MAKREEDSREDLILNTAIDVKHSRSASPSAEDVAEGSDQLLSRKREREVSLEPATPRAAATASSPHAPESKESRMSPAKKGRVQLDTTVEEDDAQQRSRTPSHPHSPPLSVSPPHEVKVRQISQGVEDISWRQKLTGAAGAALSSQERDTDHDVDSGGDDGVARAASGEDDMVQGEGDDKDGEVGVGAGAVLGGAGCWGAGGSGGEDASGEYRDREPEHEPDREATFGEKLRAERDGDEGREEEEDGKVMLTEQSVQTGEEEEETVHQNQWRERGTGTLKLNVRQSDGGGARLVMRKEAVYTVILNVTLFSGMKCFIAQDPRYLRFSVIEDGATTHYNLRVSNAKMAQELLEEINLNIPAA
ncbi:hypothetical protein SERLADRAFT_417027 [Serpula lacrymans var. lacrymans S7.9]|uniref:RanBD1 domain-containing protein n=1 Tax=Serpula lacrymans var. lacrymans (strain S7.9) TaxID=578457 RepID=F8P3A4_SERL9|nr:uncharacterized protein SERLADRAFT_417027 [Serpula lacrymans var. lacrymans S7.9]EGO22635.1 hypothetical protein SERLADRAFT_417027 [Serpula lacrymans var. lacrymans S7.9]